MSIENIHHTRKMKPKLGGPRPFTHKPGRRAGIPQPEQPGGPRLRGKKLPKLSPAWQHRKDIYESNKLRDVQALQLRAGGMTYDQITVKLGYPNQMTCYNRVKICLRQYVKESSDRVRKMELYRLDGVLRVLWAQGIAPILGPLTDPANINKDHLKNLPNINVQIVDRILHIMERRSKYLDLDAPTKIAPTDPTGKKPFLSDEERMRRVMQMLGKGLERKNGPIPNEVAANESSPTGTTESGDTDGQPAESGFDPTE
jgi:hypothetical protein